MTPGAQLCGACATSPPPFSRTLAPLLFAEPVSGWVHAIKFGRGFAEAKLLSALLGDTIAGQNAPMPNLLAPVPLACRRLLRRGHNQATLLAAPLARRFGLTIEHRALRRRGHAPPQRGQPRQGRAQSIRGVFQARTTLSGRVAIVDDVMTTGATASELARVLLAAGADSVDLWVAARVTDAAHGPSRAANTT